jgi:SPP1 gp7 family putative phage head morphogenesis protein
VIDLPSLLGARPKRKSRKKPKPLKWPHGEAMAYAKELGAIVDQTTALLRAELIPALGRIHDEANANTAAPRGDDSGDTLSRIIERIRQLVAVSDEKARGLAITMLERVQRRQAVDFQRMYQGVLPINPLLSAEPWLRDQMQAAVTENVRLIKSIPDELLDDVQGVVSRAVMAGTRVEDISDQVRERFGVAENRAVLIATDQVGKWHGNLNRLRQQDAGVSEYIWTTSHDEVVRPLHAARDGKKYAWSKPLEKDPFPGQGVRCRCQAVAMIDEL